MTARKKIAAIITEYRPSSHADVIVTKFLNGFPTDEGLITPRVQIASMYVDQFPANDLSREYAAEHDIPICDSIAQALTLGSEELAVDGVLLIGEHGDYAWNEREQHLYPRKYFMEQICGVMATSGRAVPVFNDKHLSYNWQDAKWMIDRARELGIPFMAGSSLPLGWRNPWLEHPVGVHIAEAVVVAYSGLDVYGFHALETLQCMVERRAGGECGVKKVLCLEGDAVWQAAKDGRWTRDLAEAALARIEDKPDGSMEAHCKDPALFLIEYRDGLRGAILMLTGTIEDFAYAAVVDGQCLATEVYLQSGKSHGHFSYLSLNIEEMFVSGRPTYPVERTLLTTGILEAALESRFRGHVPVETPHLEIEYQPSAAKLYRPSGPRPSGATVQSPE